MRTHHAQGILLRIHRGMDVIRRGGDGVEGCTTRRTSTSASANHLNRHHSMHPHQRQVNDVEEARLARLSQQLMMVVGAA